MTVDSEAWTPLTRDQTDFFRGQVEATQGIAFSTAAHAAGIVPLVATRHDVRFPNGVLRPTMLWPDPYEPSTSCVIIGRAGRGSAVSGFSRVTADVKSSVYAAEGVIVNTPARRGSATDMYGQVTVPMPDQETPLTRVQAAAFLIDSAMRHLLGVDDRPTPGSLALAGLEVIGMDGPDSARMFRSLSSLATNLVVAGTLPERMGGFVNKTHGLADALLTMAIDRRLQIAANVSPEEDTTTRTHNRPHLHDQSALFESDRGSINAIFRVPGAFPDTIVFATIGKPGPDDDQLLLERYIVRPWGVALHVVPMEPEDYSQEGMSRGVMMDDPFLAESDGTAASYALLDANGRELLNTKILALMSEINAESVGRHRVL